jgi:hypothetical protein
LAEVEEEGPFFFLSQDLSSLLRYATPHSWTKKYHAVNYVLYPISKKTPPCPLALA